jgi:hypothetical protein
MGGDKKKKKKKKPAAREAVDPSAVSPESREGMQRVPESVRASTRPPIPDLPEPKMPDRHDHLRTTSALEIQLAKKIVEQKREQLLQEGAPTAKPHVPSVDLPKVIQQMSDERERYRSRAHVMGTYVDLARYGLFLKAVREALSEEHKKATQRQRVAKALADRSKGEREWSQRSEALERANKSVARCLAAADELNTHVSELQASPAWVHAMAELRARDMVNPLWESTFAPAPRTDDDVADDITFEQLLELEKARGTNLSERA